MRILIPVYLLTALCACAIAQPAPATKPSEGKLPYLEVDVKKKQIRVECAALRPPSPLEFFCVVAGTNEHESALRSPVKPSNLHLAMLMIGLKPGEPVHWSESLKKWLPPHGPPLRITCEFEREGKTVAMPAYRMMRDVKSKKEMPPMSWIFAGSRIMPDGNYAADATGYLVSVVNFDLTVIDIPQLASNANETLEWEVNTDIAPEIGTKVTMLIEPTGSRDSATEPSTPEATTHPAAPIDQKIVKISSDGKVELDGQPIELDQLTEALTQLKARRPLQVILAPDPSAAPELVQQTHDAIGAANVPVETRPSGGGSSAATAPTTLSDVTLDEALMKRLRVRWEKAVSPHSAELREAAQAHYEVINTLRHEQQRLINEADRVQRAIDELEQQYQEMTTPRPEPTSP